MTTVLNGLLGGVVVGLLAGVVTQIVDDDPSATAVMLGRATGDHPATSRWWELGVQVMYGGLAGGLLLVLELFVLGALGVPPTLGEALGVALAWSALLFGALLVGWQVAFSRPLDRSSLGELFAYHLVYGLGLGIWIRMTWIT